jgi:sugar phosphate isomerase/epimerase
MKLAISNIAWPASEESAAARLMGEFSVEGVEIAPTAVWPEPLRVPQEELTSYRKRWEARGIEIVALQALLFGRSDLTIFGDEAVRNLTLTHLDGMMGLAGTLGARVLVFGSPKNRLAAGLVPEDRDEIALGFFRAAGEAAARHGVELCIEANPPEYGCDFITRPEEALALVRRVDRAGFGLHLDAGGMTLTREPIAATLANAAGAIRHFHASEPFLAPLGCADGSADGSADHASWAAELRRQGYNRWVSVEMRQAAEGSSLPQIRTALEFLRRCYGD